MRLLLAAWGFVAGAMAGFMAELGLVSLIERSSTMRIEIPLLLLPVLPAAIGVCGAILLLRVVRRICGPAPSLLALVNALATVTILALAMVLALAFVANPFDQSPRSTASTVIYYVCMLGPLAAMLVAWGAVWRTPA